jgi:hypothetical protein
VDLEFYLQRSVELTTSRVQRERARNSNIKFGTCIADMIPGVN